MMMLGDVVKAGQVFYYSANIDGKDITYLMSGNDWSQVAARIASAASPFASVRVVGADQSNITLAVTSSMDRASEQDIKGNLDAVVAAQPEVNRLMASMIRLTDASLNPTSGASMPFGISPAMWAVIGIGLVLLLKR